MSTRKYPTINQAKRLASAVRAADVRNGNSSNAKPWAHIDADELVFGHGDDTGRTVATTWQEAEGKIAAVANGIRP